MRRGHVVLVFFKLFHLLSVILQLRSIEMMLDHGGSNVNSSSLKLMDFSVDYTRQPCICSEYDCALYIMLMMERHNMRSTLNDAEV